MRAPLARGRKFGYNVRMKSSAIWLAATAFAPWAAGAVEVSGASLAATLDEQAKGAVTRLVTAHGATPLFRLKLTRSRGPGHPPREGLEGRRPL